MSRKQFEKFYWPGLKQALLCTIEMNIVPIIFCEGQFGNRLEYFLELPKGKVICLFDLTDMFRAKEVLRDHACIAGNVPPSLLQIGSPQEVEEYCAKLIKVCGKGGGFILSAGSSIDEAKPANIKALVDSPRKYSV
jgi:uroporphyrinogen-III decarboxylase